MLSPVQHQSHRRRRFGLTELLLIAGILTFGALTLLSDGRQTLQSTISELDRSTGG